MTKPLDGISRKISEAKDTRLYSRQRLTTEVRRLSRENEQLRREIDELRRDSQRIAEIYDLVVDRLSRDS
ncbi:hypothetical protein MN032_10005 [Agromyces atrinae]|jgi:cell division protein FtsB|uniref:Cell division protein FtsB n=1 Tax=Agromyces atrinae TaxID=592376 RepID=A0A4Q2M5D7_9MICO|nr:hypothetical protein [Agromyces atrinae]MCI2958027.1 hypothetical protein [Agromyces atrinae]NYD66670.1 cell division protein FtsB [Agromyces atrinae]RXZ87335.1 hypothetical protein ESP50_05285 [Agromyces atrinae]